MNAKTKALSEEARKLTPEERIELVEDILGSLHPTDPEIDLARLEEARDRLELTCAGNWTLSRSKKSSPVSARGTSGSRELRRIELLQAVDY